MPASACVRAVFSGPAPPAFTSRAPSRSRNCFLEVSDLAHSRAALEGSMFRGETSRGCEIPQVSNLVILAHVTPKGSAGLSVLLPGPGPGSLPLPGLQIGKCPQDKATVYPRLPSPLRLRSDPCCFCSTTPVKWAFYNFPAFLAPSSQVFAPCELLFFLFLGGFLKDICVLSDAPASYCHVRFPSLASQLRMSVFFLGGQA